MTDASCFSALLLLDSGNNSEDSSSVGCSLPEETPQIDGISSGKLSSRTVSEVGSPTSLPMAKKRVSNSYTAIQKTHYVDKFRHECSEFGYTSQRQFAKKNGLSHARFSAWCKEYDQLKSLDTAKQAFTRVRSAQPRFPILEARVLDWVLSQRNSPSLPEPSVRSIQKAARAIALELGIVDFMASNTWVERFKKRCKLTPPVPVQDSESSQSPLTTPDILPDDNFTTDIQDVLIDHILQDFLSRSTNSLSTPIECAGLGLSHFPVMDKLKVIQIADRDLDFESDVSGGESSSSATFNTPPDDFTEPCRVNYTPKQRSKYLTLYQRERMSENSLNFMELFCRRHQISPRRMTAWLGQQGITP